MKLRRKGVMIDYVGDKGVNRAFGELGSDYEVSKQSWEYQKVCTGDKQPDSFTSESPVS
jgi:hypothetical protein